MPEEEISDDATGLPFARTWGRVYLLVVLAFALFVGVLVLVQRMFS
jgi:hypothetical protein